MIILVVDDEPGIRDAVAMLLEDEGHRVRTARDGAEALALLAAPPPTELVVSDVMMPLVDGFELIAAMRARGDRTPIVLVTAGPRTGEGLPGVTLVRKPFGVEELLAAVAAARGNR